MRSHRLLMGKIPLVASFVLVAALGAAPASDISRAESLFRRTQYEQAIQLLREAGDKDPDAQFVVGRSYFMMGEFKKASEAFERAVAVDGNKSDYFLWLGRAYGRRAETSSPFTAPGYATKARQNLEKAVTLDNKNLEAINDLFEYYLEAPGFLGGGVDKAVALTQQIAKLDPVEVHYALAQIAERKKEYQQAEQQLRRAMELAPHQVGRIVDLAKFLGKRGRLQESEEVFQKAEQVAPNSPRVLFARASVYIENRKNLDTAKALLQKYLKSPLTPDDPTREEALRLLAKAGS